MTFFKNIKMFFALSKEMYQSNRDRGKTHQLVQNICPEIFKNKDLEKHTSDRFVLKVQWYAVEMLWLCERFNRLLGQKSSLQEQKNYIYAALLIAVSDWLIDDVGENPKHVKNLFYDTQNFQAQTFLENYYVESFTYFEENLQTSHKTLILKYFYKVHEAQFDSQAQFESDTPKAKIDDITKAKSAYLTLLALAFAKNTLSKNEESAFYELGGLVQFINDIQDLHKDTLGGIKNFANSRKSLGDMEKDLLEQKNKAFTQIKALDYPKKELTYFLFTFEAFVKVTQARLKFYNKVCKGNFDLDKFIKIPKEKVRFQVFSFGVIRDVFPKILGVNV